jgi:O-antigen/teichoic acid export membrane protein
LRRRFFSNISLLILLNIIVKAFWVLGIDRTVQNRVGADEYGFYFSLFSFTILFNILLDFGITNYNNRKVAANPEKLSGLLGNLFLIRIFFAVVYMIVSITFARILGYSDSQRSLLWLLLLNQFIASFILYLRSNITALQLFRIDALLSVADRFIMMVVCALLLWGGFTDTRFRIEWFIYSQTAGYSVTFVIALIVVFLKSGNKRVKFSIAEIPTILKESAPFAILALFMAVYWRIDAVMIERMINTRREAAGIYAQAFRLLDAASMIPYLFAIILLPVFSKAIAGNKSTIGLTKFATQLLIVPATVVTVISALYPDEIMNLLYSEHTVSSAAIYRVLMLAFLPVAISYIYSTILTAGGNLRILNTIAGSGMVINIVLNYILIPLYGALGSAIASVGTQLLMSLLFYFSAVKVISMPGSTTFILSVLSNLLLLTLVALVVNRLGVKLLPGSLIIAVSGLFSPLLTRLINLSDLRGYIAGVVE